MTVDPFGGELPHDGRIYGRGPAIPRAPAAMLWALRDYATKKVGPNNIALLFSVDEGLAYSNIRSFLANDYPALGRSPPASSSVNPPNCTRSSRTTG
ncbi:MAG: hypothetical protein R3C45_08650 [Phycisphaerales bacterium]